MHQLQRNLLYQLKKQSASRVNPLYCPNQQQDSIRAQNQKLRAKLRSQQTQIIRLQARIDDLNEKINISNTKYDSMGVDKNSAVKNAVSQFSKVPMIMENKQLKENNEILNKQLLVMNGKINQLEAELRKIKSEKYALEYRIKQFNILEKMRQQRFKDEVDRLTPIIIQQPSDFSLIKNAIIHLTGYLRDNVIQVVDNLFILSTKQCQGNKKLNSFTVFRNYFKQIKQKKSYGFAAALGSYRSMRKVMKMLDQGYGQIELQDPESKQTLDEWVINSIFEIKAVDGLEQQRKLFRFLALKYRCKFPIKGQKWDMNEKTRQFLQNMTCNQLIKIILPKKVGSEDQN